MSLYPLKTNHHRRYVPIHTCPYTHSKQTTTDSISLYTLKTKHRRRYVPIHTQNKARQAVPPYTHFKQSTTDSMSLYTLKQNTTDGKSNQSTTDGKSKQNTTGGMASSAPIYNTVTGYLSSVIAE